MNPNFKMLAHQPLMLAAGIVIGAWLALQYPDATRSLFSAPLTGLACVLVSVFIQWKHDPSDPSNPSHPISGTPA